MEVIDQMDLSKLTSQFAGALVQLGPVHDRGGALSCGLQGWDGPHQVVAAANAQLRQPPVSPLRRRDVVGRPLDLAFITTLLVGLLCLQKVAGLQLRVLQACRRDTVVLLPELLVEGATVLCMQVATTTEANERSESLERRNRSVYDVASR